MSASHTVTCFHKKTGGLSVVVCSALTNLVFSQSYIRTVLRYCSCSYEYLMHCTKARIQMYILLEYIAKPGKSLEKGKQNSGKCERKRRKMTNMYCTYVPGQKQRLLL
jgi:hypothetical protein